MEFRILGPLEVVEGDRDVALGGPKDRALLAVLLLHANEVVPSERLIDELWGEAAPVTAAKSVHLYGSHLRRALRGGRRGRGAGDPRRRLHAAGRAGPARPRSLRALAAGGPAGARGR